MVARVLFQLGSLLFMALGVAHVILMVRDRTRPRYLVPVDDQVRDGMNRTALRLTRQTTMWKAWLGFNLSHALGLVIFGLTSFLIAVYHLDLILNLQPLLFLVITVAAIYLFLAIRFWFFGPAVGSAIGLALFVASAVVAWTR